MAQWSLTIVKSFPYRDETVEEFSNTYHLSGTMPTTDADWLTLANAIWTSEKTCVSNNTRNVRAYGHDGSHSAAVWAHDWKALATDSPGTLSTSGFVRAPGDAAAVLRWGTGDLNSKGKPIYLRKYFHDVYFTSGSPDALGSGQVTALAAHGALAQAGFVSGAYKVCRPSGTVAINHAVLQWITTRTLKRRGKRP